MPSPPPNPGLCASCVYGGRVTSAKGSVFWRCKNPELPRYPELPVRECGGYVRLGS